MSKLPLSGTLLLVLVCASAVSAGAQVGAPDTLRAVPADGGYLDCLEDLRALDLAAADLDSIMDVRNATVEERDLMRVGARDRFEAFQARLETLAKRLPGLAVAPDQADSVKAVAVAHLDRHLDRQWTVVQGLSDRVTRLWSERANLAADSRVAFEARVAGELELTHEVTEWYLATASRADILDHGVSERWPALDAWLTEHAETLMGRARLTVQERDRVHAQLTVARTAGSGDTEVADLRLRLQVEEQRLNTNVEALRRTIRFLEQRRIDASAYRQTVVQATGEVSEQLLDPEVMKALAAAAWKSFTGWMRDQGPTALVRVLSLLAFVFLFRWTARLIWMLVLLARVRQSSRLLQDLIGRMLMPTASVLGLLAGMWFLGVDPTTLLAGVGVISVILGLALQDSLGNLAAGAFILLYRPYDVDDTVQAAGVVGMVKAMGLANTTIVTFDNRRLFVPNRKIWSEVIENRSMENRRRVDTTVRVVYGEDVERVMGILRETLLGTETVLKDPEPMLFVSKMDESWVEIEVRPWASRENWWGLYTSLPQIMLETLQAHGIRIPYQRRDVAVLGDDRPGGLS